jgi:hypothetical protein
MTDETNGEKSGTASHYHKPCAHGDKPKNWCPMCWDNVVQSKDKRIAELERENMTLQRNAMEFVKDDNENCQYIKDLQSHLTAANERNADYLKETSGDVTFTKDAWNTFEKKYADLEKRNAEQEKYTQFLTRENSQWKDKVGALTRQLEKGEK